MDSDLQTNLIDSPVCMVGFASMGDDCGGGIPPFEWAKTFADLGVATVLMRDRHLAWYQKGVGGLGNIAAVKAWMQDAIMPRYAHVITAGVSMGGYAALLFGMLSDVDEIIAMSPQTFIDPEGVILGEDDRWRRHWSREMPEIPYRDLQAVEATAVSKIQIIVGDDPDHPEYSAYDLFHARRIGHADITVLDRCSHSDVGRRLRDSGYFKNLIAQRLSRTHELSG